MHTNSDKAYSFLNCSVLDYHTFHIGTLHVPYWITVHDFNLPL